MTKQEERFLEALGITPGPWKSVCNGYVFSPDGKLHCRNSEEDGLLVSKSPELFLFVFYCACYHSYLHGDQIFEERTDLLLSAQTKCKTWKELYDLWKECEE